MPHFNVIGIEIKNASILVNLFNFNQLYIFLQRHGFCHFYTMYESVSKQERNPQQLTL